MLLITRMPQCRPTFQSFASLPSIIGSSGSLISPSSTSSTFFTFSAAWMRSSSEKVRLCRFLRAWARKCWPTGSISRWTGAESWPRALKSFSPVQPAGRSGRGNGICIVAMIVVFVVVGSDKIFFGAPGIRYDANGFDGL